MTNKQMNISRSYGLLIWVKWTSLVLIIDGSNYETMSAANEDHYATSQPQPMYWEVSVLQKIESGYNFDHSPHDSDDSAVSGRGPGAGASCSGAEALYS